MKRIVWAALALVALTLGCSDEPTEPPAPTPGKGTITVTPASPTVLVHQTQALVAAASSPTDSVVTWRLLRDPALADTVDVGTIVSTGARSATYTAPDRVVSAGFDYMVTVFATSNADTTVRGVALITVPRVRVLVSPGSVSSVPPGTLVPFQVAVTNAPTPGFTLFVDGIAGGDAGVGTWVATGPASAVYTAPARDSLFLYGLLARSVEDPARFGTANVTVRAGFPMPTTDDTRDEFAPEWDPTRHRLAYVRGGATWNLVIYDFGFQSEQVLTALAWSGLTYDGRIAWSEDGSKLVFSEESGGRRVLGVVHSDGSGRDTFAPEVTANYDEACFMPTAGIDSIYVTQHTGLTWSLRAYPLAAAPGATGRTIYTPPASFEVHSPDAAILPPGTRPVVGFETVVGGDGTVRSLTDDGGPPIGVAYSSATARTKQVRWAILADGVPWLTFVHEETHNVYRVQRSGLSLPQRCYVDYFPESASDLKAFPPPSFEFLDAQAVARLEPSGRSRIWIIGFPPSSVVPVSRAMEIELRRVGVWKALTPLAWRRWGVTP